MKRSMAVCAVLFVALVAVQVQAADEDKKIDVSGGWNVEVDVAGNTGTPVFTFKQDGGKLTGRYKGRFGEADLTGKLSGDAIEFEIERDGAKIVYTGTVKKDRMEGTVDYAGQASGTWSGQKIDLTGSWNVEVDLGGNSGTPEFTFKQEGEKLTGTYKGQFGEAPLTGSVKGDAVEFTFGFDGNEVKYTGTVTKDALKGEADYAGQASGTWTGKRKATEKK